MGDFMFWAASVVITVVYLIKWIAANESAEMHENGCDELSLPQLSAFQAFFVLYFGMFFILGIGFESAKLVGLFGKWNGRGNALGVAFGWALAGLTPAFLISASSSNVWGKYSKFLLPIAKYIIVFSRPRQFMQLALPAVAIWLAAWVGFVKMDIAAAKFGWVILLTTAAVLAGSYLIPDLTKLIKKLMGKKQEQVQAKSGAKNAAAGANQQQQAFSLFLGQSTGELANRGHVKGLQPGLQVSLSQTDAATNMLVFGGIGAGKTTRVINPVMLQLMRQNCGGLIFDIKSDFKRETNYFAEKAGRKITTIGVGQKGINLLKGLTPEKAGTFLKSAFILESGSVGQNAYWIDNAVNMCIGALGVLEQIEGKYSLYNLYEYVFIPESRKIMSAEVQSKAADLQKTNPIAAEKLNSYINRYETHFGSLDAKTKGLIESTVSTVLVGFTNPDIKKGFCEDNDQCVEMQKVLEGEIYLVDLPLPLYGSTAKVIYMWTKLLWFNVMQQRRVQKDWNQDRPVFFLCDEYQEIIAASKTGDSDLNFWDKSRSSGAIGIISMQHISSLYSAIGNKDVANTIMANFRQKICFRTEDETTLQYFNKMLGKVELKRITSSVGASSNNSGGGTSSNRSEHYYHQDVLDAQTMRGMDSNYAVAMLNINNVACDDVIALQPAFVPTDYVVSVQGENKAIEVYKMLSKNGDIRVIEYEKAYENLEVMENIHGRESAEYAQASEIMQRKKMALDKEIGCQLSQK